MQEVQFIADLSISMLDGIIDFQAARITRAYKIWDEDFPEKSELDRRFDRVFDYIASVKPEAFRDTVFNRSPLFYSLVVVLDSLPKLPSPAATADLLFEIDNRFLDPRPTSERPEQDLAFVNASTATTQRIRQRTTRDTYIRSFFG